jgi:uncharacterized protein (DUF2384 family)
VSLTEPKTLQNVSHQLASPTAVKHNTELLWQMPVNMLDKILSVLVSANMTFRVPIQMELF